MRPSICLAVLLALGAGCAGQSVGDDDGDNSAATSSKKKPKHDMAMPAPEDGGVAQDAGAAPAISACFYTPSASGQQPVIDAINGAKTSIHMMMFHLTVMPVVDALVAAAGRGVAVSLIMDAGNWTSHTPSSVSSALTGAHVTVTESSSGFSITHTKALLIDGQETVVMSLNLTSPYATTRDYAVETWDPLVASEFEKVFQADLANAAAGTATTPALDDDSPLLWSPVDSEAKLVSFIGSAQTTLVATSENLGDTAVMNAFAAAAARGVEVRLISPLCDQNANPLYDYPSLISLDGNGVQARAMPQPASATQPYMHAKMMIADGHRAYVGSMNYSTDSLQKAREVGIFFSDPATIAAFSSVFEQDWAVAVVPPADSTTIDCPATTSN